MKNSIKTTLYLTLMLSMLFIAPIAAMNPSDSRKSKDNPSEQNQPKKIKLSEEATEEEENSDLDDQESDDSLELDDVYDNNSSSEQLYGDDNDRLIDLLDGAIDILITQNANLLALGDTNNRTPLIFATLNLDDTMMQYLLDKGVNTEAKDIDGETALFHAVAMKFAALTKTLVRNNANTDTHNNLGQNLLHAVITYRKMENIDAVGFTSDSLEIIQLLIENGVDINAMDNKGKTPLHYAIQDIDLPLEIIQSLMDNGANANAKDNDGKTPLEYATKELQSTAHSAIVKDFIAILKKPNDNLSDFLNNFKLEKVTTKKGTQHILSKDAQSWITKLYRGLTNTDYQNYLSRIMKRCIENNTNSDLHTQIKCLTHPKDYGTAPIIKNHVDKRHNIYRTLQRKLSLYNRTIKQDFSDTLIFTQK